MCDFKIISPILLILSIFSIIMAIFIILDSIDYRSSTVLQESNDNTTDRLKLCLTSTGVYEENIIDRSSANAFKKLNWQWNKLNDYVTPMAYLVAENVSDIQSAIKCCRELNIRPVARSGGHSFTKYSFGDSGSLIIDLAKLNQISVDPVTMSCEIESGAQIVLISYRLWNEGEYMITTGVCPSVGVAGLTLGGGYGYFTRYLGLASDNLIELEMVDAQGELLVVNNSTNEDLFWALRGGGGGSFGIVTNFKFKMHSAPKYIAYGVYLFDFEDFPQFFYAWQSLITSDIPDSIGTLLKIAGGKIRMEIYEVNLENRELVKFEELLKTLSFPMYNYRNISILTYSEYLLLTYNMYTTKSITTLSQNVTTEFLAGFQKAKSIYVDKILAKEDISKLYVLLTPLAKTSILIMELNGGAINKLTQSETAFIHSGNNLYLIQLSFHQIGDGGMDASVAAMTRFYEESKAIFNHRESYQNYLDQDMPDYLERYYGENLKKLIEVKTRIDPENIFHHPQSIPVNSSFFGFKNGIRRKWAKSSSETIRSTES